ncbi:MAG: Fic family protein [Chlamydiota bacterium]
MINNNITNLPIPIDTKPIQLYSVDAKDITLLSRAISEKKPTEGWVLEHPISTWGPIGGRNIAKLPSIDFLDNATLALAKKVHWASSAIRYISQFTSSERMVFIDGRSGVFGQPQVEAFSHSFPEQTRLKNLADEMPNHLPPDVLATIEQEKNTDMAGYHIQVEGEDLIFGSNPKRMDNTTEVIRYILNEFDTNAGFFSQSDGDIVAILQKSHELLFNQISTEAPIGSLRAGNTVVFSRDDYDLGQDHSDWPELLKKHAGTKEDLKILKTILKRISPQMAIGNVLEEITPKEKAVCQKIAFLPPTRYEIAGCLKKFEQEFKNLYKETQRLGKPDYIKLAAFAHQNIVDIHPFHDGNGRLARVVMNSLLIQGEYCPVFFPSDQEYTEATKLSKKQDSREHFENYLKSRIERSKEALVNTLASANMPLTSPQSTTVSPSTHNTHHLKRGA